MRVTKLIREYVEKSVREVYQPKIDEVGAEYLIRKKALEEQLDAFVKQCDDTAKKMIADAGFEIRYNCNYYISTCSHICNHEIEEENQNKINALRKEMKEKTNDILLNLELGATRAELDEMIRNLK